mmetsp:Transcript_120472/g.239767  ORF Transcript_120472/g.239767 Transcript_120472/m.239767 type:complete len:122 (-) Transcript_120472:16-381(-)|eukprot:CAMPEP_0172828862 /NCGR_PEP_ID=MMETSP1075-20121228/21129_1 /TAXON_ID=2916 /ORGANISM="Ceratium fusus, Strain PA161109" /LENGTH=121 /DNA_ID=CAMNT_0013670911 /DNA_START=22 /DNA_END=387 /DNA_ORIENTATION=+
MASGFGRRTFGRLSKNMGRKEGQNISLIPMKIVLYIVIIMMVLALLYALWTFIHESCCRGRKCDNAKSDAAENDAPSKEDLRKRRLEKLARIAEGKSAADSSVVTDPPCSSEKTGAEKKLD